MVFESKPNGVGGISRFKDGLRWLKLEGFGGFERKVVGFMSRSELVWSKELEE